MEDDKIAFLPSVSINVLHSVDLLLQCIADVTNSLHIINHSDSSGLGILSRQLIHAAAVNLEMWASGASGIFPHQLNTLIINYIARINFSTYRILSNLIPCPF
jgi:hypothetical protein